MIRSYASDRYRAACLRPTNTHTVASFRVPTPAGGVGQYPGGRQLTIVWRSTIAAVLVIGALASTGGACVSTYDAQLELYEQALQLTIETLELPMDAPEVEFSLRIANRGAQIVDACLGWSRAVSIQSEGRGGTSSRSVDHPGCVTPFSLEPGGELAWVEALKAPVASPGPARLEITIEVLNPKRCDAFGCSSTKLRAVRSVTVRS